MLYDEKMEADVKITQEYLKKEITFSMFTMKILKKWSRPLLANENHFRKNSPDLLATIDECVVSALIASLYNIFTNPDEVSLSRFINQIDQIDKINEKENYIKKIISIRRKLNPLRNTARSHNIPWRKKKNIKVGISTLSEWLSFADETYKKLIRRINRMNITYPMNGLVPEGFDKQIERNFNLFFR